MPQGGDRLSGDRAPRQPRRVSAPRRPRCSPPPGSPPRTSSGSATRPWTTSPRPSAATTMKSWASGRCRRELYKGHPYGHPIAGRWQGLKAITLDDVKAFHSKHYTREAFTLGMAGGLTANILDQVESSLASSAPARHLSSTLCPSRLRPRGLDVTIVAKPAEATAISMGFPIDVTRRGRRLLRPGRGQLVPRRAPHVQRQADARPARQAGLNYGDYSYIEDFIQEGMSTFPVPNNPATAAILLDLDPAGAEGQGRLRAPRALWELDRLVENGMSAARLRGHTDVPAQLQQALGPDALAPAGLRDGRHVLRPRGPRHRAGRAAPQAHGRPGQRRRPQAPQARRHEGRHRRPERRRAARASSPRASLPP